MRSSQNISSPYSAISMPGIEPVMRCWLALEHLHYALPKAFALPSRVALVGRLPRAKFLWQIAPRSAARQNPQDRLHYRAVLTPLPTAVSVLR
jgi:hypothetical protein